MKIGDKEYSEIFVTDSKNHLLASIADEDIIAEKDCKVVCVPIKDLPVQIGGEGNERHRDSDSVHIAI